MKVRDLMSLSALGCKTSQETDPARRAFLLATLSALAPRAWGARVKRIGVFIPGFEEQGQDIVVALAEALRPHGWREGVTLEIVLVALGAKPTPEAAAALVRRDVDVLFTANNIPAQLLKEATATIPIVAILGEPVRSGFAQSLNRPGGNITGLAFSLAEVQLKSLDLARTFIPRLSRFRLLRSALDETAMDLHPSIVPEARQMGIVVDRARVLSFGDLVQGFKGMSISERGAAFVTVPFLPFDVRQVAELAIASKVATFSPYKQEVREGLLASYSKDFDNEMARVAAILNKILRGANPAEIAFEQPTRTHIAINTRTAAALGLAVPPDLLSRADEVIS